MPTVCSLFLVYVWLTHFIIIVIIIIIIIIIPGNNNNNNNNNNEYLYRISYQFY